MEKAHVNPAMIVAIVTVIGHSTYQRHLEESDVTIGIFHKYKSSKKMSGNKRELSRELARAVSDAIVATRRMDPTDVISTFDELEASFLPKVGADPMLVLETKRRIAERKFLCLSKRRLSFDLVLPLIERVRDLGYTNLDKEVTLEIIFARFCIHQNHTDQAVDVLEKLCSKLDQAIQGDEPEIYRDAKQTAQSLLHQIVK